MSPSDSDQTLAVAAEVLYLANLLLLPGLAFVALLALWRRHRWSAGPLGRCHLRQTVSASLWAGALLILANALIILLGGYRQPGTWVVAVLYFTIFHSSLVLLGVLGLARAMAGQVFVYPVIGRRCDG